MRQFFFLVLTHNTTVNLFIGSSHVYIPNAIAGTILCSGTKELCERMQPHYIQAGYDVRLEVIDY